MSDFTGKMKFFATGIEGYSRLEQANPKVIENRATDVEVAVTTIDDFCHKRDIVPNWITLDVEGFEKSALCGARETINARRSKLGIIVEMHPNLWEAAGTSREEFKECCRELAIRPIAMTGQQDVFEEYGIVCFDAI